MIRLNLDQLSSLLFLSHSTQFYYHEQDHVSVYPFAFALAYDQLQVKMQKGFEV